MARLARADLLLRVACGSADLVLPAIQDLARATREVVLPKRMALISSLGGLLCVAIFCFLMAAFGQRVLRWGRIDIGNHVERILVGVAIGMITFEAALAIIEPLGKLTLGIVLVILAITVSGISEYLSILRSAVALLRSFISAETRGERFLLTILAPVLLFEGLAAVAPLTGSDALHYHFASPLLVLRNGFHPEFFLAHSFLTGQGHLLVLAGLAAGTDKLALASIYLGGVLAAAATACIARKWASRTWALLAALAFLLTPVVFWQITAAGAPDIWMAFFAAVGVLLVARAKSKPQLAMAAIAGLLAGAVAGTKYTGCIVTASLLAAFVWETPSLRRIAVFFPGALVAGIWPYARNLMWTGDPVFPFALRWLSPGRVNGYALTSLLADTGASAHTTFWQLAKFPLFAWVDFEHLGFWQFFGPLCLLFTPMIVLAVRNTPLWRAALVVWVGSSIGIGASTGMSRFLLPILPIALAAAFAGAARLHETNWHIARAICVATIASFLLLGLGGFALYSRSAVAAAAGLVSREAYLQSRSPDFGATEFVNRTLGEKETGERALVFFRHVYYLRVPFVYGDPSGSWAVDPARLGTAEAWREFLQQNKIRWVVRAPDYPEVVAAPLRQLETEGKLLPYAQGQVSDFEGMRLQSVLVQVPIAILRVSD